MSSARVVVNPSFVVSEVDPRLYSGFLEHLGRAVYDGVYEPGHPDADEEGFRRDVLGMVKELDMPFTRYPGGNFVSGYDWEDGVGPREKRPVRLDIAWKALEPNTFGTDEFVRWCRKAGTAPMLAVNLGTRGAAAARDLVEYCNFPGGTHWSDLRIANGSAEPHNVRIWCLGNEMDGAWQTGHKNAEEYGRLALEAAKMMKWIDPTIELVVCGSSAFHMPTFGSWESTVLEYTADLVDYLSLHMYFNNGKALPLADYCAQGDSVGPFVDAAVATADAVTARKHLSKKIMISFDEWNVWYHSQNQPSPDPEWTVARRIIEDTYDMADLLVDAGALNQMINRADRVKIACIAQTVNVIAPIMTEKNGPAWKQTIFYPLYYASRYGRGTALRQRVESPELALSETAPGGPKSIPALSSAVTWRNGEVNIFAINRDEKAEMTLTVELQRFGATPPTPITHLEIVAPDLGATNSAAGEKVSPRQADRLQVAGECVTAKLAPASWNLIRVKV